MTKNEQITYKDVYELIDKRFKETQIAIGKVSDEVSEAKSDIANINGRLFMVPILISSALGVFFFIMNLVINKR